MRYRKHSGLWLVLFLFSGLLPMCAPALQASPLPDATQEAQLAVQPEEPAASIVANGTVLPGRQVTLRTDTSGQVAAVHVKIGEAIQAGQVLVRLEPENAKRTIAQAEAALLEAETRYKLTAAGPTEAKREAARYEAVLNLLAARQALDALYKNAELAAAQAFQELVDLEAAVWSAERWLNNLKASADPALVDAARAEVILAGDSLKKAEEAYQQWERKPETNVNRANSLAKLAAAQQVYDAAVRKLNSLSGEGDHMEIRQAEAALALAQVQLGAARESYAILSQGPDPDALALAEARVENAQAALELAESGGPTAEQLELAQAQINTARVNLAAAQAQMENTRITAPFDGVVATVTAHPGDWVAPSQPVVELMDVSQWVVETKNVSELEINQVALGQPVVVQVNAYQGESLDGEILMVSPVAVIQQGDVTYTLHIALPPTDLHLRAGMTARVQILPGW